LKVDILKQGFAYEAFDEDQYNEYKSELVKKASQPILKPVPFTPQINDGIKKPNVVPKPIVAQSEIDLEVTNLKNSETPVINFPYSSLPQKQSAPQSMSSEIQDIQEANTTEEEASRNPDSMRERSLVAESPLNSR
jgi:hypothetical protein